MVHLGKRRLDPFRCLPRLFSELSHFLSHHRKTTPLLTGTRRLDRRVKPQEVCLLRDIIDELDDLDRIRVFLFQNRRLFHRFLPRLRQLIGTLRHFFHRRVDRLCQPGNRIHCRSQFRRIVDIQHRRNHPDGFAMNPVNRNVDHLNRKTILLFFHLISIYSVFFDTALHPRRYRRSFRHPNIQLAPRNISQELLLIRHPNCRVLPKNSTDIRRRCLQRAQNILVRIDPSR